MGSACTANRRTRGGPGLLDGYAAGEFVQDQEVARGVGDVVVRVGPVLPNVTQAIPSRSGQAEPYFVQEDEVVVQELWFRLTEEEQARFGGCFSQMVLRMLDWPPGGVR